MELLIRLYGRCARRHWVSNTVCDIRTEKQHDHQSSVPRIAFGELTFRSDCEDSLRSIQDYYLWPAVLPHVPDINFKGPQKVCICMHVTAGTCALEALGISSARQALRDLAWDKVAATTVKVVQYCCTAVLYAGKVYPVNVGVPCNRRLVTPFGSIP